MSLRFARRRFFTAALLVAALAIPTLAFASGGNSVRVKVPHTVYLSKGAHYTVSGSSSASNTLELLTTKGAVNCKSTFAADYRFELFITHVSLNKGSFRKKPMVFAGIHGTYRLCAYIVSTTTTAFPPPTLAHAPGAKFVIKG